MKIRLAHRLHTDFQYFLFLIPGTNVCNIKLWETKESNCIWKRQWIMVLATNERVDFTLCCYWQCCAPSGTWVSYFLLIKFYWFFGNADTIIIMSSINIHVTSMFVTGMDRWLKLPEEQCTCLVLSRLVPRDESQLDIASGWRTETDRIYDIWPSLMVSVRPPGLALRCLRQ